MLADPVPSLRHRWTSPSVRASGYPKQSLWSPLFGVSRPCGGRRSTTHAAEPVIGRRRGRRGHQSRRGLGPSKDPIGNGSSPPPTAPKGPTPHTPSLSGGRGGEAFSDSSSRAPRLRDCGLSATSAFPRFAPAQGEGRRRASLSRFTDPLPHAILLQDAGFGPTSLAGPIPVRSPWTRWGGGRLGSPRPRLAATPGKVEVPTPKVRKGWGSGRPRRGFSLSVSPPSIRSPTTVSDGLRHTFPGPA